MIRYTVTYTRSALNALASEWLNAPNRSAVTQAGDEIDRQLSLDAHEQGQEAGEGLRQLIVPPLIVKFTVSEDDRLVTIWSIRHIGTLTNGH